MKRSTKYVLVVVTAPDLETARCLATAALDSRLVACVNIVPGLESKYWWKGKLESASEVLLLMKTTCGNLARLERIIASKHPYEIPEFLAFKIHGGSECYLRWVEESVAEALGGLVKRRRKRSKSPA